MKLSEMPVFGNYGKVKMVFFKLTFSNAKKEKKKYLVPDEKTQSHKDICNSMIRQIPWLYSIAQKKMELHDFPN
jgi:hypothetical protein